MEQKKYIIELKDDAVLVLKTKEFTSEDEIDVDSLLRIDMQNLAAEMVTAPVILNRFGSLKAKANEEVSRAKLEVEVYEGQLAEELREKYFEENNKQMSNERVSESIARDRKYKVLKMAYFRKIKNQEMIDSVYWSLKIKNDKLDALGRNMDPGDIEESLTNMKLNSFNFVELYKRKSF